MSQEKQWKSAEIFEQLKAIIDKEGKKLAQEINATFLIKIIAGPAWFLDLKSDHPVLIQQEEDADVTIIVSDSNFVSLATGKLNAQKAYIMGKLKIKGNIMLASKISTVFGYLKPASKL